MLKSLAVRAFVALLVFGFAGVAAAELPGEVSHSAMAGSTLMPTTAQFNSWTHWIVNHDNFVELNVGDSPFFGPTKIGNEGGQATLHWKYNDDNHLLFRVRQHDLGGQNFNFLSGGTLGEPMLPPAALIDMISVADYNAYAHGQMLNLAWAKPSGEGAFSVGVLFANAGYKEENGTEYNDKSTAFGGQVTWGNGDGLDLAGSFYSESATEGPSDTEDESSFTHFDLAARLEGGNGWIYQLGGIMGTGSIEPDGSETTDVSLMGVTGNLGQHLYDAEDGAVTAEFYVNYMSLKGEQGDEEETMSSFVVPGTRVACWAKLSNKFRLMAGANAYWMTEKEKFSAGGTEDTESERGMTFGYAGGLAFVPNDRVRIEAELDMDELNRLLSLGNDTPLLMRVGGTVTF